MEPVYTVTQVSPARLSGKLRVRLSDGGWFLADEKSEAAAGLTEGVTLTAAALERWRAHGGLTVLEAAGVLLGRRAYSARELSGKLTEKGFTAQEIGEALEKLREMGLVDDAAYGRDLTESLLARGKSARAIREALQLRGIDRDTAEALTEALGDQTALARSLAERKYGPVSGLSPEVRRKAAGWLARRGFEGETVRSALRSEEE